MESVGSHHDISNAYYPEGRDPDNSGQKDLGRSLVAATDTAPEGKNSAPRIRMYTITDLKDLNKKHRDEDRARSWTSNFNFKHIRD